MNMVSWYERLDVVNCNSNCYYHHKSTHVAMLPNLYINFIFQEINFQCGSFGFQVMYPVTQSNYGLMFAIVLLMNSLQWINGVGLGRKSHLISRLLKKQLLPRQTLQQLLQISVQLKLRRFYTFLFWNVRFSCFDYRLHAPFVLTQSCDLFDLHWFPCARHFLFCLIVSITSSHLGILLILDTHNSKYFTESS